MSNGKVSLDVLLMGNCCFSLRNKDEYLIYCFGLRFALNNTEPQFKPDNYCLAPHITLQFVVIGFIDGKIFTSPDFEQKNIGK